MYVPCVYLASHGRLEYPPRGARQDRARTQVGGCAPCAGCWLAGGARRSRAGPARGRALTATAMRERPGPAASGGPRVPRPRRAPRVCNSEQRAGGSRTPWTVPTVRCAYRLQYSETGDRPHTPFRLRGAPSFSVINSGGPSPVTLPQPRCWAALDREPPTALLPLP